MSDVKVDLAAYSARNEGDFPESFEMSQRRYVKVEDLRYGTNPHQSAAFCRAARAAGASSALRAWNASSDAMAISFSSPVERMTSPGTMVGEPLGSR